MLSKQYSDEPKEAVKRLIQVRILFLKDLLIIIQ